MHVRGGGLNKDSVFPFFRGDHRGGILFLDFLRPAPVRLSPEKCDPGDGSENERRVRAGGDERIGLLEPFVQVPEDSIERKPDEDRRAEVKSENGQLLGNLHASPFPGFLGIVILPWKFFRSLRWSSPLRRSSPCC